MPTISGTIIWQLPQADGSINVRESFVDDQGNDWGYSDYAAPDSSYDIQGRLTNDVAALQSQADAADQQQINPPQFGNISNRAPVVDAGAVLCAQLITDLQAASDAAVNDPNISSLMSQLDAALGDYD